MDTLQKDVESFLADIAESPQLWRSLDLRVLAVRIEGAWHNLVSRCTLNPRAVPELRRPEHLPRTDEIIALYEAHPPEDLPTIIQEIRKGVLSVEGYEVRFVGGDHERRFTEPYRDSSHGHAISLESDLLGDFTRGHMLTLRGGRMSEAFNALPRGLEGLNRSLRTLAHPWDGMNALSLHGIGDVREVSHDMACRIHFIAPHQAMLTVAACSLIGGVLRYQVVAGSRESRERCVIGLFGRTRAGKIVSKSIQLTGKRWHRHPAGYSLTGTIVLANAAEITVMLHLADQEVGRLRLVDRSGVPPAMLTAAQSLIPEARRFEQFLLDPQQSESREFERAVVRLFGLCGLIVDAVGDARKTSNSVDAVVRLPDGNCILAVECTTGALQNDGKLGKLVRRTAQVREALRGDGVAVVPVMISSWSEAEASSSEIEAARKDGVLILWREHLRALYNLAMSRAPVGEIIESIIPAQRTIWQVWGRNPLADVR